MPDQEPPGGVHVTYSQQYRRCQRAGCRRCADGGQGHGPYWFAYWRVDGRLHSRYLGKQRPPEAAPEPQSVPPLDVDSLAPLRVRTLGGLAVWRGARLVPADTWRRRKVAALLSCLLSAPDCRLPREAICEALWPDADPDAMNRNLHATIHHLRRALDLPGSASLVQVTTDMVTLNPGISGADDRWFDARVFAQAARAALAGTNRAACTEALNQYDGDYLPEEPYADWVVARREELRVLHLALLLHGATLARQVHEPGDAERYYRAVLTQDHCHEDAAYGLITLLADQGRRADALRVYQALAAALDDELGLSPSDEVEALRSTVQALGATHAGGDLGSRETATAPMGNLPIPLTSFVGRAWESREIAAQLTSLLEQGGSRLLTLTGAGGCGKTRLALAAAVDAELLFPDGTWLVELAALRDETTIPQAVARILGVRNEPGTELTDALLDYLRPRQLLLILDNCEHLAEACAAMAALLLRSCPRMRMLLTSRSALGVLGERVWPVPPMATPPAHPLPALDALPRYEAVQLFLDRARAVRRGFVLDDVNAAHVARICRQLDGLPLAIELAAARLATQPISTIVDRLDDRFRLLTDGNRTALPRQRTLQATMDWSFALLSAGERALFRRLAAFSGGCTLDGVIAVCANLPTAGDDHEEPVPPLPTELLPDLLAALVRQSLVQLVDRGDRPRYILLETVRHYAHERLVESGEEQLLARRHRDWCLSQVLAMRANLVTPDRNHWMGHIDYEIDNIRSALVWNIEHAEAGEELLRLVEAMLQYWLSRGLLREGEQWMQRALAAATGAPARMRAQVLNGLGALVNEQGESRRAQGYYEEGLALFREAGEPRGVAFVLVNLGNVAKYQGDLALARARYEESSRTLRSLGDQATLAVVLNNLGALCLDTGDIQQAAALLEESLAIKRTQGGPGGAMAVISNLAEVARRLGNLDRATSLFEEHLTLAREQGNKDAIAIATYNLGLIAAARNDTLAAAGLFGESLVLHDEAGNKRQIAHCLEGLAALACRVDAPLVAGHLLGAVAALRETAGVVLLAGDRQLHDEAEAFLHAALDDDERALALSRGHAMTLHDVIGAAQRLARSIARPLAEP